MKLLILYLNLQFLFMTMKHSFENWLICVSVQSLTWLCKVHPNLGSLDKFKMDQNWKVNFSISSKNSPSFRENSLTCYESEHFLGRWRGSGTARQNVIFSENFCSMAVDSDKFMESLYAAYYLYLYEQVQLQNTGNCFAVCAVVWPAKVSAALSSEVQLSEWCCAGKQEVTVFSLLIGGNPRLCMSAGKWSARWDSLEYYNLQHACGYGYVTSQEGWSLPCAVLNGGCRI